jgi:hypothetical protein
MDRAKLRALKSTVTTTTASNALEILRQAFPLSSELHSTLGRNSGRNGIAVPLPRKDHPTYVLPNNKEQPWELLPTKAAAYAAYPNFFNASCGFFGSIGRDVSRGKPSCVIRPSVLALDLSKALQNLGIIRSFEVAQHLDRISDRDYVWPEGEHPQSAEELRLYPQSFLRLNLR